MTKTIEEMSSEYAPYNEMPAFHLGIRDYQAGIIRSTELGVHAQAYDRGAECAMRLAHGLGTVDYEWDIP